MEAIVAGGVASVAVEPLAVRLGATKGSFYHHFPNRDALIVATLDEWERSQTEAVIERVELIPDPGERLRAVLAAAFSDRPGGLRDAAVYASATHQLVRPTVKRVTDRRLRYFTERYVQLGFSRPRARRRAVLLYQSYLGLFSTIRLGLADLTDAELAAHAHEVLSTLVPNTVPE
ncbi:MAG: TetR/AcrR family transcriptional regulator [Candidatus Dormibacteraeota bacterium]|nr:TetR/AcrR family transcriptional regulator [Candidatus Dormibacteraeota bacterium]